MACGRVNNLLEKHSPEHLWEETVYSTPIIISYHELVR